MHISNIAVGLISLALLAGCSDDDSAGSNSDDQKQKEVHERGERMRNSQGTMEPIDSNIDPSDMFGKWKLADVEVDGDNGQYAECESNTVYTFSGKTGAPTRLDSSRTNLLSVQMDSTCAENRLDQNMDASWYVRDNEVWISQISAAGTFFGGIFDVFILNDDTLCIGAMDQYLTFVRLSD